MKHLTLAASVLFAMCVFTFCASAQITPDFDGKYVGKFEDGGFEDSLIIENSQMRHVRNKSWGYGVEHLFVYALRPLKGEMMNLKQIAYFKDRVEGLTLEMTGSMDEQTIVLLKDKDGNLEVICLDQGGEQRTFYKVE